MFARADFIKVKPGCEVELTRTFEQGIIPLFRKEKNFRGLLAFTFPNGTKALSLSLWDREKSAGASCPTALSALTALARAALGTLSVQVFEVSNSTFYPMGQIADQRGVVDAPPDLSIYQSALRPFKVSPARHTRGRGFPPMLNVVSSMNKGTRPHTTEAEHLRRKKQQLKNISPLGRDEAFDCTW